MKVLVTLKDDKTFIGTIDERGMRSIDNSFIGVDFLIDKDLFVSVTPLSLIK